MASGSPQIEQGAENPGEDAERRGSPRVALMIRTAKLISGEREYLCIIRDVSHDGLKLRLFDELPPAPLLLEVQSGERFLLETVWCEDGHAGFRFPDGADRDRLLELSDGQFRRRPVRLRTLLKAVIGWGEERHEARFENLSQQGACVRCDVALAIDQLLRVECAGLPAVYAKVRWRRRPLYGLVFEHRFTLDELAGIAILAGKG